MKDTVDPIYKMPVKDMPVHMAQTDRTLSEWIKMMGKEIPHDHPVLNADYDLFRCRKRRLPRTPPLRSTRSATSRRIP
jgi:hypothetical protein